VSSVNNVSGFVGIIPAHTVKGVPLISDCRAAEESGGSATDSVAIQGGIASEKKATGTSPGIEEQKKDRELPAATGQAQTAKINAGVPRILGMEDFSAAPGAHLISQAEEKAGPSESSLFPAVDLSILAAGKPSADAALIEKVVGIPLTEEGLAKFYEGAMPGIHAMTSIKYDHSNGYVFTSGNLRNGDGERMGSILQVFTRHQDGALELNLGVIEVEPKFREKGLVPALTLRDCALLQGLSSHPDTRLTLRAAGYVPGDQKRHFGNYVWARYGIFDFRKPECLPEMLGKYSEWVDKKGKELSLDGKTIDSLKALSTKWSHPSHVAEAKLPGVKFPAGVDGREPQPCDVGKAFLLSDEAPAWYGTFPVNRPLSGEAEKGRQVLLGKINDGEAKKHSRDAQWASILGAPGTSENMEAVLKEIGREGGPEWLGRLESLKGDRILGAGAKEAAERIEGKRMTADMAKLLMDNRGDESLRLDALGDFERTGGHLDKAMADALLTGTSMRLRGSAFNIAFRNAENDYDLAVRAAGEVLARTEVPEKTPFWPRSYRLDAVRALMTLQGEEAIPKFEKLSRMEKDSVTRQAIADCIASLRSGKPQGIAALPVGEYPPETWK